MVIRTRLIRNMRYMKRDPPAGGVRRLISVKCEKQSFHDSTALFPLRDTPLIITMIIE